MALLFMDSFDHYATADLVKKWTEYTPAPNEAGGIIAAAGRRGSAALKLASATAGNSTSGIAYLSMLPASPKIVVGFAVACVTPFNGWTSNIGSDVGGASAPACLLSIQNAGLTNLWVKIDQNGMLSVWRATSSGVSVYVGTTSLTLVQAVYTYIEIEVTFSTTVGTVAIRFNGTTVLNLTGQNTVGYPAYAGYNGIRLGPLYANNATVAADVRYDDMYVLDGSGSAPWNTFLGDCRVEAMLPSGAGTNAAWSPSAGANWQCVDDAAPNDDTDYVVASTVGLTDTHVVPDLLVAGTTVFGVQHCISAKKADAGLGSIAPVIRHSSVDYAGANLAPNTGYNVLKQVAQVNPGTSAQWTMADFNAAEFGYRRTV